MVGDSELMDVILNDPHMHVIEVKDGDIIRMVIKTRRKFNDEDRKKVERTTWQRNICLWHRPNEYNRIVACENAKEI